ncbi:hypothetical protein [Dyella subtropica]|uniref:hypothetical protein n=1 Tax=Dyella subtropica TaxID=2992127 RepID=UPI00225A0536|nr:hypothetical protein [Dyella subtropica]
MWFMLGFAAFVMLVPAVTYRFWSFDGESGDEVLNASFAEQRAMVHGVGMPASSLRVVHRWHPHTGNARSGEILEIDAHWLCLAGNGQFVIAIAQGVIEPGKVGFFPFRQRPLIIRWAWRSLTQERVRQMLTATPSVYRRVFGTNP